VKALGGGITNDFADQSDELNDNIARLELSWRSFKVMVVAQIVPAITTLVEKGTKLSNWVRQTLPHTKLLETAVAGLAVKGVLQLSSSLGPLNARLLQLSGTILKVVLPLLALEDFLVFLAGGESLIGDAFDAAFGPGGQAKVRAFGGEVALAVAAFKVDDLKEFFDFLAANLGKSGGLLNEFGSAAATASAVTVSALTNGWTNFFQKLTALIDAGMFSFEVFGSDMKTVGLTVAAELSDAFDGMWNGIISGAQSAIGALADIASHIPGAGDFAKGLRGVSENLEGDKRAGDAVETVDKDARRRQKQLGAKGIDILDRLNAPPAAPGAAPGAPGVPPVVPFDPGAGALGRDAVATAEKASPKSIVTHVNTTNNVKTEVKVPPGTDREQADGVARAAESGARKGTDMRAAQAALTHHD
jgi:hypothetical protein